jgi:hypothetical protein
LRRRALQHVRYYPVSAKWRLTRYIETALRQVVEDLNPYPDKPKVHFRPDGTFKLLVLADLHFGENPWDAWGPEQDKNSTVLVGRLCP